MSDYEMTNGHDEASNWVRVPGFGRLTYQELENRVGKDIVEIIDHENKKITYRKA